MTLTLWFASWILVSIFIVYEARHKYLRSLTLKAASSLTFVLVGLSAIFERLGLAGGGRYDPAHFLPLLPVALLCIAGLVSGLIGDILLALRPLRPRKNNDTLIINGIIFFSIGHLFYLGAQILYGGFQIIALAIAVLMTLGVHGMSVIMKFAMGKTKIPVYFYSFLIFVMIGQAVGQTLAKRAAEPLPLFLPIFLTGAIFFGISDLILAPIYFKHDRRNILVVSNLVTYYFAQFAIAASILYL